MATDQKRFSALGDGTGVVEQIIRDRSVGDSWFMGMDFDPGDGPVDLGTRRLPLSRVALLTDTGIIPASMLPGSVTTIVPGDMEFDRETGQWTFTAEDGTVYGCPRRVAGQEEPDEGTIYLDNTPEGEDYYQYMFVPAVTPTDDDIGTFYSLPSPYIMVDGDGTHVHDDAESQTRSVNVRLTDDRKYDAGDTSDTSLAIVAADTANVKYLAHKRWMDADVTVGDNSGSTSPGFGETVLVPYGTFDKSGHLRVAGDTEVTIPATPATDEVKGLVVISADNPQPVGSVSSAGGSAKTSDGYVKVSAADHTHAAAKLTLHNDRTGVDQVYDGSAAKTFDFSGLVGATLPEVGPTAAGQVLYYNGTALEWVDRATLSAPAYVSVSAVIADSFNDGHLTWSLKREAKSGTLDLSNGKIVGMVPGHVYMATYSLYLKNSEPTQYYEPVEVSLYSSAGETQEPVRVAYVTITANGSRTGDQYYNGVIQYVPDQAGEMIFPRLDAAEFTGGDWSGKLLDFSIAEVR